VWVEGPEAELDAVEMVRYTLHPTFPDPVRTVTDRQTAFKLDAIGWGEFTIQAQIIRKDGGVVPLQRWIALAPAASPRSAGGQVHRPRIFVSASAVDRWFVRRLAGHLKEQGVDALSDADVPSDAPLAEAIRAAVTESDLVAVVISGEIRGFAQQELELARERQKAITPILLGRNTEPPSELESVQCLRVDTEDQIASVADALAAQVKDLTYED
jgi:hypothetical protein